MKNWVKGKYEFDFGDITTGVTTIAVILSICGFWWSTIIFIVNCIASIVYVIVYAKRLNLLFLNIALLIFNITFLF